MMIEKTYLAAQYLAAAGIQNVDKKEDDSHTNLGFDSETGRLKTHQLSENGDVLQFNYNSFSLEWKSKLETSIIALNGKTHSELLVWLNEKSKLYLGKEYAYSFHYEATYPITSSYVFELSDPSQLQKLLALRTLVQTVLEIIVRDNGLHSDIRIWPHHFDSGAYSPLKENDSIAIGLGMAIPDSICDTHYFYISGYKNGAAINVEKFTQLSQGKWINNDFKGAVLPVTNMKEPDVLAFFQEAINQFKNT